MSVSRVKWEAFCDTLKQAGELLTADGVPQDEQTQAEGLRYLSRIARAALEWYVEFNDPEFPELYKPSHETIKIGADNPDNIYEKAVIDGRYDYLLTGHRGTVDYISMATSKGSYAENFTQIETGFLDSNGLVTADDGSFLIVLSQHEHEGNWLPIDEDSESLLIRQTFLDRTTESPAVFQIRRRDSGATPEPLSLATATANFDKAIAFYKNTLGLFARWSQQIIENPNTLPLWDQSFCQSVGGDPNILYYHGHFRLNRDQAFRIRLERIPECQTWNLQVDNYWMESLDYRYHRISINKHTAEVNADGSVTLIVTPATTNATNALSTAGHTEGTLCFRWVGTDDPVHPEVAIVPLTALAKQ
jgi:hypothetical protein